MKKWQVLLGMAIFLVSLNFAQGQNLAPVMVKRYAIIVGANDGGKSRVHLRYAVTDAKSFRAILEELGGVAAEDCLFLPDPDTDTFSAEMLKLQAKLGNARTKYGRIEVLFYYSGHSDETHLLLNEGKISYEDLRSRINRLPADMRIAILDSCSSGAFTRRKGGKKRPIFFLDEANSMQGYAFMTSSSSSEASQESDLLKSSFFTHYLLSGLRGAADLNQDSRVTLNEAYQFAFNETLAETTQTLSGPQHPNYDIQMTGAGDVVMTDIRKSSALLILGADIAGRIFIHDQSQRLVLELTKPLERRITLALEEGKYRVIYIGDSQVFESSVNLKSGKELELFTTGFVKSSQKYTTPRGDRSLQLQQEFLAKGFVGRPITSNVTMPTGSTLKRGEFTIGFGPINYGISNRLQIGTNVSHRLFHPFNADMKVALVKSASLALAVGLNWESYDLNFDLLKLNMQIRSYIISSYIAVSPKLSERVTLHFSGRYSFFSDRARILYAKFSTDREGTSFFTGLELSLSNRIKLLFDNGYDTTFNVARSGTAILFGGKKFRLKLGMQYYKPSHLPGISMGVAGLWWHFGSSLR